MHDDVSCLLQTESIRTVFCELYIKSNPPISLMQVSPSVISTTSNDKLPLETEKDKNKFRINADLYQKSQILSGGRNALINVQIKDIGV